MRLTDRIYLVGGGWHGFGISHNLDCHVYLIDGGSEMTLIDAGVGLEPERIHANIRADGLDDRKLKYLLLTHGHADHAGGSRYWKQLLGVQVIASPEAAQFVREGQEASISLDVAKSAGFYPADYRFQACPVDRELKEGDTFRIGACELQVIETPGHCAGLLSYKMNDGGKTYLFSGDTVFHDGKVLITNVYDCNLQHYVASLRKLAGLKVDALLPGHSSLVLDKGQEHIQKALDCLARMLMPPNLL